MLITGQHNYRGQLCSLWFNTNRPDQSPVRTFLLFVSRLLSCVWAEGFLRTHLQNSLSHVLAILALDTHFGIGQGDIPMWKSLFLGLAGCTLVSSGALAQSCSPLPNTLANGAPADATQVMGNFNFLSGCAASAANPSFTGNGAIAGNLQINPTTGSAGLLMGNGGGAPLGRTDIRLLDTAAAPQTLQFWGGDVSDGYQMGYFVVQALKSDISGQLGVGGWSTAYTFQVNGTAGGTSAWQSSSDQRLKKNIRPLINALAMVTQLQGVRFDWRLPSERLVGKSLELPTDEPQIGFIAQDLKKVLPEVVSVSHDHEALMSVAESKLVPVLVEAVKELKAANDNQAAELQDLKIKVSTLERHAGTRTAQR